MCDVSALEKCQKKNVKKDVDIWGGIWFIVLINISGAIR